MNGKFKSAIAIFMIALSFTSTAFAGTNNLGGGSDYEFDVPVETEPSTNKKITIDIINTKIKISTPSDADPSPDDDDFKFDDEDNPVATPSEASPNPEKPINIRPKDPAPELPKDDIVNYPANIQTPPTPAPEPEYIEKQKVGTIEAYYEHSRHDSRAKYYIDDNGVLRILPPTGDSGYDIALVSFAISLAGSIYFIYKHRKKKGKEESSWTY